jgi:hypothetical protein
VAQTHLQEQAALEAQGLHQQRCAELLQHQGAQGVASLEVLAWLEVLALVLHTETAVEGVMQEAVTVAVAAAAGLLVMEEMAIMQADQFTLGVVDCLMVLAVQQQVDLVAVAGLPVREL